MYAIICPDNALRRVYRLGGLHVDEVRIRSARNDVDLMIL